MLQAKAGECQMVDVHKGHVGQFRIPSLVLIMAGMTTIGTRKKTVQSLGVGLLFGDFVVTLPTAISRKAMYRLMAMQTLKLKFRM
jgi:hypothetical protein